MFIIDSRGNIVGTPAITLNDHQTAQINIQDSIPPNYSGTLKYAIHQTNTTTNTTTYLLTGNIDCVDTVHQPAATSTYLPNATHITIQTTIGTTQNIIIQMSTTPTGTTPPEESLA
jgi:hypothetical protein